MVDAIKSLILKLTLPILKIHLRTKEQLATASFKTSFSIFRSNKNQNEKTVSKPYMIEWLIERALFPFTPLGGQDRISPYNINAI